MIEIGGHDNRFDVGLQEEGRTRVLLDVVILDCWGKNGILGCVWFFFFMF